MIAANNDKVTVILPVHNRQELIARAITSVLDQTHSALELIVVDDGSTDGTRGIVEGFADTRLRLIAGPQRGVYAARNIALQQARGELVAFIDSDDRWLPDRLESQIPLLDRPEVGLVFGDVLHVGPAIDPRRRITSFHVSPPSRGRVAKALAGANFVPTISVLARRKCLVEIGGFSEQLPLSADYLAWFRIALAHDFDYVDRAIAEYTIHPGSLSHDLGRALAARIELFSTELRRTSDPSIRALLRRLLFNLSMHLALAVPRGRARNTPRPLQLARRTFIETAGLSAPAWATFFLMSLAYNRLRRLVV